MLTSQPASSSHVNEKLCDTFAEVLATEGTPDRVVAPDGAAANK